MIHFYTYRKKLIYPLVFFIMLITMLILVEIPINLQNILLSLIGILVISFTALFSIYDKLITAKTYLKVNLHRPSLIAYDLIFSIIYTLLLSTFLVLTNFIINKYQPHFELNNQLGKYLFFVIPLLILFINRFFSLVALIFRNNINALTIISIIFSLLFISIYIYYLRNQLDVNNTLNTIILLVVNIILITINIYIINEIDIYV